LSPEVTAQLIMVNDGSSVDLSEGVKKIEAAIGNAKWISYPENQGKGYALRTGVQASNGDYLLYTDHDLPYTADSMIAFIELMHREGNEIIIGHRDETYYQDLPWFRVKLSHYLKTINTFILRLGTDDTQCGLKGFSKSIKPIFLETQTNRFLIDIEFLRRLKRRDKEVIILDVKSRDNVKMSTLGLRTILSELWAYFRIILTT
jgi:glycosyltransferase involved in cell wall biosynthesis